MADKPATNKGFVFRVSRENLVRFSGLSAEEKLDWLEEANRFVSDFVPEEKIERWKAFVERRAKS